MFSLSRPPLPPLSPSPPSPHSAAEADGLLTITSVWSRSPTPASALASDLGCPTHHGDAGLAAVLADPATAGVLVVLPVQAMPAVVSRALAAGKAVLQEKPVAPTVGAAVAVARVAAASGVVWALAENYRSEPGVAALAAAASPPAIGLAIKADLAANMPMNAANRYHGSVWRRDTAGCPGGFLMDSSVHFLAALRAAVGPAGAGWGEAVAATAVAYGADGEDGGGGATDVAPPPSPDTLVGHLTYANGRAAAVSITFAGAVPSFALSVEGRSGAARLARGGFGGGDKGGAPTRGGGYSLDTAVTISGGALATTSTFHPFAGLDRELRSFLRLLRCAGTPADAAALSSASAARDLAVVEALLASAAGGGARVDVAALEAEPWSTLEQRGVAAV